MNTSEYERMFRLEDSYWWFAGRHRLVEGLLRNLFGSPDTDSDKLILDVGCGTGATSARLARWGRVVSVDFSPLALSFSRRRGLKQMVGADAMQLPFADAQFDLIVAMDMLEHLPDDEKALSEFQRVLKPGGCIIATVPAYMHLWSEHDVALMHFRRYTRAEFGERFIQAGLVIKKLSHTMMLLYPILAIQRRLAARKKPSDSPEAAMPHFPAPINAALTAMVSAENKLASKINFPFGVTILCIASRPD